MKKFDVNRYVNLTRSLKKDMQTNSISNPRTPVSGNEKLEQTVNKQEDFEPLNEQTSTAGEIYTPYREKILPEQVSPILQSRVLAMDTETEGLARASKLIGVSVSPDGQNGLFIRPEDISKINYFDKRVVFHNAKFDLKVLQHNGLPVPNNYEDTMIMAFLLDENRSCKLKDLAEQYLGVQAKRYEEIDKNNPSEFTSYATLDANWTMLLYENFNPRIKGQGLEKLYREIELPLINIVIEMEETGITIDEVKLESLKDQYEKERKDTVEAIYTLTGHGFNINSHQQIAEELKALGIDLPTTAKGNPSTKSYILESLANRHPVIELLLSYNEKKKLLEQVEKILENAAEGFADPALALKAM